MKANHRVKFARIARTTASELRTPAAFYAERSAQNQRGEN
jgi:hypothetical protein